MPIPPARGELPPPAWDLVDIERYRAVWRRAHGHFSLNMAASRGCSFRCAWCAKPIWGNHYLQRPAAEVAAEMTRIKREIAPDHIWFADDIFGFRVDWVREFAEAIAASGGAIPFTIQTRADLISERMAAALRAAGCREAWLGAESGSQRVLDAMNKGIRVAQIHSARARLRAAGIRVGFFIQLGYLGEELPDILATRDLIETARPDDVGVSVAYPLPGTKFHDLVSRQLGGKTHWQASGELAMMFQGTYTSAFYREVRDLLHAQVSLATRHDLRSAVAERARRSLQRRWSRLLGRQESFLNTGPADRRHRRGAGSRSPLRARHGRSIPPHATDRSSAGGPASHHRVARRRARAAASPSPRVERARMAARARGGGHARHIAAARGSASLARATALGELSRRAAPAYPAAAATHRQSSWRRSTSARAARASPLSP